jgi:putative transposase
LLDGELETWRNRSLGQVEHLILDARYKKVCDDGTVRDCAVLIAIGVLPSGHWSGLGVSCSLSEAEVHWRSFLVQLMSHGMTGVQCIVSDDHSGLKAARRAVMPSVPWQRCQFHLMQNAMNYIPRISMREEAVEYLRAVFNAKDSAAAREELRRLLDKYQDSAPGLVTWSEDNVPEGLTVFQLPAEHQKRMRTTNLLESQNKELKRRTRVATLVPNEASLLRLVSAVLAELTEEWETGKDTSTPTPEAIPALTEKVLLYLSPKRLHASKLPLASIDNSYHAVSQGSSTTREFSYR